MVMSSQGSLSIIVLEAILAVPKQKGATFTPSMNLGFCGLSGGKDIEAGVFAVLVHLFGITTIFRFTGFGLICNPEYLLTMKAQLLLSN